MLRPRASRYSNTRQSRGPPRTSIVSSTRSSAPSRSSMKTPKHEPPSKADDKASRRPRPLKPASWIEEVRPDDDVMAVFYGRTPSPQATEPGRPAKPQRDSSAA